MEDHKDTSWSVPPPHLYGQLGLATAGLEGIGGVIKSAPEDFIVEEIPAYEPLGEGDHLFVKIEKRLMTTRDLVLYLSRSLKIPEDEIGVAGMKDKMGITCQSLSLPRAYEDRLEQFHHDDIRILAVNAHPHKLKTGHLRGNRFTVMIRGVNAASAMLLPPLLTALSTKGFLNFYDTQRLGERGRNARDGLRLLTGEQKAHFRGKWHRRLMLSAAQAALFNIYLFLRHQRYGDALMMGDLVAKRDTGGVFWIDDLAACALRQAAGEIVATGPVFGAKMRSAQGASGEFEQQVLAWAGLPPEAFAAFGKSLPGSRRPLRAFPIELTASELAQESAVRLSFILPAGSYATVLLAEITKPETLLSATEA